MEGRGIPRSKAQSFAILLNNQAGRGPARFPIGDLRYAFQPGMGFSETTASFAGDFGSINGDPRTWTEAPGAPIQFASAPTFSPAPATYPTAQAVTISNSTPGATIYYTVDGSAPTTKSTVYSNPITVPYTETINAIAVAPQYLPSSAAIAAYFIGAPFTFVSAAGSASTVTVSNGGTATYTMTLTPFGSSTLPNAVSFSANGV